LYAAGELAQLHVHAVHGRQHFPRLPQQGLAGSGRLDAAAAPQQERRAQGLFDGTDALAHRRGHQRLARGRAGDVALFAHRDEELEGDRIESATAHGRRQRVGVT
jgi:hypothetical protein